MTGDARKEQDFYGDFGNSILYKMCSDQPDHKDVEIVHGKLWLIGRAYAAAVERKSSPGFLVKHAAQALVHSSIDCHLASLRKITRPESKNILDVLAAHHYLTEQFRMVCGQSKRSLASKYLHFHAPTSVFIYDSVTERQLIKLIPILPSLPFACSERADSAYTRFVWRCLQYRDHFLEPRLGRRVDTRTLDKILYVK